MAIDPSCNMMVLPEKAAEKLEYGGKEYYFCSMRCRERFEKDPEGLLEGDIWEEGPISVAYFSMEIGLDPAMPTYSGGLGVLAGDTIRSAADLKVPMAAVTLLYRKGYFYQRLGPDGWQTEEPVDWEVGDFLEEMPRRVAVTLEGRTVWIRAWRYIVRGAGGHNVPVYFLDTDLPENYEWDRSVTHYLYGGDNHYRLCQEVVLGIGGVRMLRALGHDSIERFHMNEGHPALLTMELLDQEAVDGGRESFNHEDIDFVRAKCVFTTHTPVPAGHDQFPVDLVEKVLGHRKELADMKDVFTIDLVERVASHTDAFSHLKDIFHAGGGLNMTYLALNLSRYVNGVAKKHGEVSRLMFAGYTIDAITNGVHAPTWVSKPFAELFDRHIPGWRQDNFSLRYALSIPVEEVWQAHAQAKKELIRRVNRSKNAGMDVEVFTIGFARRVAEYKRGDLIFHDTERLKKISSKAGTIQIIYAGKAHPQDKGGKEIIKHIFRMKELLKKEIKIAYLDNYDIELGKLMTAGVDIWLNTPQPPLEASGTSGMKAAMNGVPSFSILDGWWIEGCIEGITGWAIGSASGDGDRPKVAASLYDKLEKVIIPLFYNERGRFTEVMKHAIALNGSFFNTHRMMQQYVLRAYF
ncbi:MAG: alpha-glucan family phosphorylase [Thermodesulfobacteriota bacterium]|nr:MAG: alpha-glucan family phosphorylase [Thermodesulfobacteriota bacterium]